MLLLLTTVVAVFLAAANGIADGTFELDQCLAPWRAIGGGMLGLVIGLGTGLAQPRPVRATLLGIFLGFTVGAVAGTLLTEPRNFPLVVVGSLVLIVFSVVIRVLSDQPPDGKAQ